MTSRDPRRSRLVLAVLLVACFGLITVDLRGGAASPLAPVRRAVGDLTGPLQAGAASAVRPMSSTVDNLRSAGDEQTRIAELERENDTLRLQLRASGVDRRRVEELDELLRVAGIGQYRVVPARVIAIGPAQGFAHTATIDAGERDGLRADLTVLNGDGLVGRVKSVTRTTATLVLASDPAASVGVRLENGKLGVAHGGGPDPLEVDLFDPTTPVGPGNPMVTFGSSGSMPFVPGVPVGEVLEVLSGGAGGGDAVTKRARVRPYVDFGALDLVGVVVEPPQRDPRSAVLPPAPAPAPGSASAPAETPPPAPAAARAGTSTRAPEPAAAPAGPSRSTR